jgi:hypothetical protein
MAKKPEVTNLEAETGQKIEIGCERVFIPGNLTVKVIACIPRT